MTGTWSGLPAIRACLFDMDGLLIDSEDLYTKVTNEVLHQYGKGDLPWNIKVQLSGRPGPEAGRIFHQWAQLPISEEEFMELQKPLQAKYFPTTQPLPGVRQLLTTLTTATTQGTDQVHLALATSSQRRNYELKSDHLSDLFQVFPEQSKVLGDDPRIPKGRGKPAPDIYLLALETINAQIRLENQLMKGEVQLESLDEKTRATVKDFERKEGRRLREEIKPQECLVFEDAVLGVEAGRRAGMQCVWCPHPGLLNEYRGREKQVLAATTGEGRLPETAPDAHANGKVGKEDDGWARMFTSLENFPFADYGIHTTAAAASSL